jgi:hypothetical protein
MSQIRIVSLIASIPMRKIVRVPEYFWTMEIGEEARAIFPTDRLLDGAGTCSSTCV